METKIVDYRAVDVYAFCYTLLQVLFGVTDSFSSNFKVSKAQDARRDLVESDFNIILPKLEKSRELLDCVLRGLRYDPSRRMTDLRELLAILETYKDYQNTKCRFSHDKYHESIMCLAGNINILDIDTLLYENERIRGQEMSDSKEAFGVSIMTAILNTGMKSESCILKMSKAITRE